MSALRIDEIQRPVTLSVEKPVVVSSFGPEAILRETIQADSYNDSGFSVEFHSVSPNSLILAKEVIIHQPIKIRFKTQAGAVLIANAFDSSIGAGNASVDVNDDPSWTNLTRIDGIQKRPMGFLRSWTSCVLTVNGTSFSSRVAQSLTGLKKLWVDNRFDKDGYGDCAPYTNVADASFAPYFQKGCDQKARNALSVDSITYNAHENITDIVYEAVLESCIPVGPFFYACFPAARGLAGGVVNCLPHISDFTLEVQYNENPLIHWFATPPVSAEDSRFVPGWISTPAANVAEAKYSKLYQQAGTNVGQQIVGNVNLGAGSQVGPDWRKMWNERMDTGSALPGDKSVLLMNPYLTVQHIQPPNFQLLQQVYTIPSCRIQCYETAVSVEAGKETFQVDFPYLKLDQISAMYMIWVEDAERDAGAGATIQYAARQPQNKSSTANAWNGLYAGASYSELLCPIQWDSVKISASVKNAVLGNLTAGRGTEMDQFRVFKSFAGNPKLTFEDWKKYNQCICFNAKQLGPGVGFGSGFSSITLSVSFNAFRNAYDRKFSEHALTRQNFVQGSYSKTTATASVRTAKELLRAKEPARKYVARMVMLEPELIALASQSCSVEQIRLSSEQVKGAITGGGAMIIQEQSSELDAYAS